MKVCREDRKCLALLLPWEQVGMHLKAVLPQTSNHWRARWVLHPELWAQASGISPKSLSPAHLKSDMASPSWPSWIIASPKFSMKGVQSAYLVSSEHLSPSLTPPPHGSWQETLSWTQAMWSRGTFPLISTELTSIGFSCLVVNGASRNDSAPLSGGPTPFIPPLSSLIIPTSRGSSKLGPEQMYFSWELDLRWQLCTPLLYPPQLLPPKTVLGIMRYTIC